MIMLLKTLLNVRTIREFACKTLFAGATLCCQLIFTYCYVSGEVGSEEEHHTINECVPMVCYTGVGCLTGLFEYEQNTLITPSLSASMTYIFHDGEHWTITPGTCLYTADYYNNCITVLFYLF